MMQRFRIVHIASTESSDLYFEPGDSGQVFEFYKNDRAMSEEQHRKVRNIIRWQRIGCIVVKISETLNVSLKEALDLFYKSDTCRRFHNEETGLYLQGNIYVLNDFLAEIDRPRHQSQQ